MTSSPPSSSKRCVSVFIITAAVSILVVAVLYSITDTDTEIRKKLLSSSSHYDRRGSKIQQFIPASSPSSVPSSVILNSNSPSVEFVPSKSMVDHPHDHPKTIDTSFHRGTATDKEEEDTISNKKTTVFMQKRKPKFTDSTSSTNLRTAKKATVPSEKFTDTSAKLRKAEKATVPSGKLVMDNQLDDADDDDHFAHEERKRRRKARKEKRRNEKLQTKPQHEEEEEDIESVILPLTVPTNDTDEYRNSKSRESFEASTTQDIRRSLLKLNLPGIDATVHHKFQILDTYTNSLDAGAPTTCFPVLNNQQFFPESFAEAQHTLQPLQYGAAMKEMNSSKVWLTAQIDPTTNNNDVVERTRMTVRTSSIFCQNLRYFRPDHVPTEGCHNEIQPLPPTFNYPWCFPPTDPVHIMSIDCGIVENYIVHEDIAFTIYTDKLLVAIDRDRWYIHSHIPVQEYDEIATMGASEYPTEPGHFPNEDFHALLFLDYALPSRIPLLWPNGSIAAHILDNLRNENVLNPDRKIILVGPRHEQSYYRAKRVYYFRSNHGWNQSPYISWYGQRFVQQILFPVIERRLKKTVTDEERKLSIVVVQRHDGPRVLTNHNELVKRLKEWIPDANVQAFNPSPSLGYPMWDTAERVYSSCLLIGPHGGNLSNELYLPPGCWVIEIGFMDPAFHLPTDFYCLSRNLGHTYWLSIGNGTYADPVTADLDDIGEIIQAYKREVLHRSS